MTNKITNLNFETGTLEFWSLRNGIYLGFDICNLLFYLIVFYLCQQRLIADF